MRTRGILGLAIVTGLALTALLTPTSATASGTALCSKNEEICSKEHLYSTGFMQALLLKEMSETYAKLVISSPATTVSCTDGKFGISLKETGGALTGEIYTWWFASCNPSGCTLETDAGAYPGYSSELEAAGGGDGRVVVANFSLVASCLGGLPYTCTYEAEPLELDVEGGLTAEGGAHVSSEVQLTRNQSKSTFFCPATAQFNSRFRVYEPSSTLFVTYM